MRMLRLDLSLARSPSALVRGRIVVGFRIAFGFGLLVNFLLVASLVWVELIKPPVLWLSWLAVGVIWAGSGLFVAWTGGLRDSSAAARARDNLFAVLS